MKEGLLLLNVFNIYFLFIISPLNYLEAVPVE